MIKIYTDGSCLKNPGIGGWGFVIYDLENNIIAKQNGAENDTTNNRMELMAAICALEYSELLEVYKNENQQKLNKIIIYTDSNYVKQGITEWVPNWIKNNWVGSKGEVKNKDLWLDLIQASDKFDVEWQWVKAHNNNEGNEIADQLATEASNKLKSKIEINEKRKVTIEDKKQRIYLNVNFNEKDEVKKLGAKWDPNEKKWYYYKDKNLDNIFNKWK